MQLSPPPHPSRGNAFRMQPARGSRRSAHAEPQTSVRPPKFPDARPAQAGKRPRWGPRNAARRFGRMPEYLRSPVSAFDRNCGARDLHRTLRGSAGRLAWTGAQADLDGRPHHPRQDIEARKPLPARVRISSKVSQSQNCTPNNSRPPIKRREPIVPDGLPRRRAASGQAHTVCVFDGLGWRP